MTGKTPRLSPIRTKYPGVYYVAGTDPAGDPCRNVYISYRREGKQRFEKIGVEGYIVVIDKKKIKMTPAVASQIRLNRIAGKEPSNAERREAERAVAQTVRWTFSRLWEAWQADPENAGKRGTVKADQRYRRHLKDTIGEREPADLKPIDIDRIRLSLAKDHAKTTTISVISLIRRIERYGASKNLCAGLPFPISLRGKNLGRDPEVKRAPTDDQVEQFIRTCEAWPDRQLGDFMLFIAYTGIRRGSVRNLKWDDVLWDDHKVVLRDSKTGDVEVVISDDALELLRSHPRETDSPFIFTGRGWTPVLEKDGRPVLHKKNGRMRRLQEETPMPQLTQRQLDREPARIRQAAGLPDDLDPCHAFRRRLATKVEEAFGIATAMKAGGWKSPSMVINYTATSKQVLRDAANLLGRKKDVEKAENK